MNCGLSGSELSNAVTSHSYASVARCRFHTSRNTVPIYTPANQHCANCIGTLSVTSTPPETPYLHTTQPALCQLYRHTHCHFHASRNTVSTHQRTSTVPTVSAHSLSLPHLQKHRIYTPANQHCANCIGTLTVTSTPPETPYLHRQPTT